MTREDADYSDWGQIEEKNENIIDVLNKIRAEIEEQKESRCYDDEDMYIYMTGLNDAIDIIDKYKVERG